MLLCHLDDSLREALFPTLQEQARNLERRKEQGGGGRVGEARSQSLEDNLHINASPGRNGGRKGRLSYNVFT